MGRWISRGIGAFALLFLIAALILGPGERDSPADGSAEAPGTPADPVSSAGLARPPLDGAGDGVPLRLRLEAERTPGAAPGVIQVELSSPEDPSFRYRSPDLALDADEAVLWLPPPGPPMPLSLRLLSEEYCLSPGVDSRRIDSVDAPFTLMLRLRRRIRLRVVDEQGQAIAGARVRHHAGTELGRGDADGEVSLSTEAHRALRLYVDAPGFAVGAVAVDADEIPASRVVLRRAPLVGRYRLSVLDGRGQPLERALVQWSWIEGTDAAEPAGPALPFLRQAWTPSVDLDLAASKALSDASGQVELPCPFAGRLRLRCSHPVLGRLPDQTLEVPADLGLPGALSAELRYPREEGLEITLRGPRGPIVDSPVEVVDMADGARILRGGRTDEAGRLFLKMAGGERRFLVVRSLDREIQVRRFDQSLQDRGRLDLQLGAGGSLQVQLPWLSAMSPGTRHVEVVDHESGIVLAGKDLGRKTSVEFHRLPVGRELVLRRFEDRASGVLLTAPLVLREGTMTDLGELAAPVGTAPPDDGGPR